jgi:hypothetical protein
MKKVVLLLGLIFCASQFQALSQTTGSGKTVSKENPKVGEVLNNVEEDIPLDVGAKSSGILISNLKNGPKGEVNLRFWPEDFKEKNQSSPDPNGDDDIYIIYTILDALKNAKSGTQFTTSPSPNPIYNFSIT